jgi:hypothetical protein
MFGPYQKWVFFFGPLFDWLLVGVAVITIKADTLNYLFLVLLSPPLLSPIPSSRSSLGTLALVPVSVLDRGQIYANELAGLMMIILWHNDNAHPHEHEITTIQRLAGGISPHST